MRVRVKVSVVIGARPQFVKLSPLLRAATKFPDIDIRLIHTGQHHDFAMSGVFFDELGLPEPDVNLGVSGGSHSNMTGRMLELLDREFQRSRPDVCLVIGDTNSTLSGALAAVKEEIPVAHVEAGLRSGQFFMPEEINRRVTDEISSLLFCPTATSLANLEREGLSKNAFLVGDVMLDAALWARDRLSGDNQALSGVVGGSEYALLTIHRQESTETREQIESRLDYVRETSAGREIVLPVHPRLSRRLSELGISTHGITVVPPLSYLQTMSAVMGCSKVFTDSGGLQKEACFMQRLCVTLRSETEWPETVASGWNRLWTQAERLPLRPLTDFGSGDASERIISALSSFT